MSKTKGKRQENVNENQTPSDNRNEIFTLKDSYSGGEGVSSVYTPTADTQERQEEGGIT